MAGFAAASASWSTGPRGVWGDHSWHHGETRPGVVAERGMAGVVAPGAWLGCFLSEGQGGR